MNTPGIFSKLTLLVTAMLLVFSIGTKASISETKTINFDNADNWVQAGSTALGSYGAHAYVESGVTIQGTNVLRNAVAVQDGFAGALGTYSMRVGNTAVSAVEITVSSGGVADFSLKVRRWDGTPIPDYTVKYSDNGGTSWTSLTNIGSTLLTTSDFFTYSSGVINSTASNFKIQIQNTGTTERIMIDDFAWTSYSAGGTPVVSTPSITPASSNHVDPVEVTMSSATDGATIYYTTDGVEPDSTKTVYSAPFNVSTTTTVKAIAYKSGMNKSSVASATYTFPTEVTNIAALRAGGAGFYKLTGEAVLTLQTTTRNTKYIQDATAAIVIDDASGVITTPYTVGDGITGIIGTTSVYNGSLQFVPVANPAPATSTGNVIQPKDVTLETLADYPAQLIKVNGVTINELASGGNGTFIVGKSYNINGASNPVLRTQYALDYIGTELPATAQDIVGFSLMFNATVQLVPRRLADIKPSVGTGVGEVTNAGIYAAGGQVLVDAKAGEMIEVYTVAGQKVASINATEGMNTLTFDAKGVMIVKVAGRIAKVML